MGRYEIRRVDGDATVADAHAVRRAVFVEEQGIDESLEIDGRDDEAVHVVVYERRDDDGWPVATGRLRPPNGGVAKPERIAVRRAHRDEGLGRRVMTAIEREAREQGCRLSRLHAQTDVEEFYHGLGYETTSEPFQEAGIQHVEMEKRL
jgi:predicted GNAT family N-acyltransferase